MLEFLLQLMVVTGCIFIGARYGGVGLAMAGGLGMAILVFIFKLPPSSPPISVLLIITAVITCVSVLQASGGLDYLVDIAERILRKNPKHITILGPMLCFLFTIFCGTSYVSFSIYPVIAEVAIDARVRPERPLSMSVIAANMGITGSPMSAATAAMVGMLALKGVTPAQIMLVSIPSCFIASFLGCLFVYKKGKELKDDPDFLKKVEAGEFTSANAPVREKREFSPYAKRAVIIFALAIVSVIIFGSVKSLMPSWTNAVGKVTKLSVPQMIQIVMLTYACIMMIACKVKESSVTGNTIFRSGMTGVVSVYGIAWMTDTFFDTHKELFIKIFGESLSTTPILFGLALVILSALIFSQSATVSALMPLGINLGIPVGTLVGLFPAVNGHFMVPAGSAMIGCIAFDRTGSTKIGKYIVNHSYMLPGLVTTVIAVVLSMILSTIVF